MKKLFFIISATFLPFSSNAWEACGIDANGNTANCEYQIIDGTLTIRGTGNNGNIGDWLESSPPWAAQKASIHNVVIEDSIKDLGQRAFWAIHTTDPVQVPSSVTQICDYAFNGSSIAEIVIPNSVTSIGTDAFSWSGLEKINIPDSITSINGWSFRGTNIKNLVIPDSVTSIGAHAFTALSFLETLTISENTQLEQIFTNPYSQDLEINTSNLKIYCTGDTAKCDANLAAAGYPELKTSKATTKQINGVTYVYDKNGKLVTSSGQRTEKRIYTIDEANAVAGDKNRVSIKYR
ncbi:MAG: leucine-rich repeat domain-containing protein [Alphaproteobacteria bacterium]|nr:leucine-rich repeat domain-containing protein [Alphaproteobacteria bacterium]